MCTPTQVILLMLLLMGLLVALAAMLLRAIGRTPVACQRCGSTGVALRVQAFAEKFWLCDGCLPEVVETFGSVEDYKCAKKNKETVHTHKAHNAEGP